MKANPQEIDINAYDYPLPEERIAKHPLTKRDECKLLTVNGRGDIAQTVFKNLPSLLADDSVLIYNNTRVINARLRFAKPSGAIIEIFCLEPHTPADYAQNFGCTNRCSWTCLVGNSKRWKDGALTDVLEIDDEPVELSATRVEKLEGGESVVEFSWTGGVSFARVIEAAGEIPVPPYLNRESEASDSEDYQTVYSRIDGSVAAPTAGLHFTDNVLDEISKRGIKRCEVTLHVGAGTFRPVKSDKVGEHEMHSEFIVVDRDVIKTLASAVGEHPIVAVGTTSVRTLESLYHIGCMMHEGSWNGELPQWYPYAENHPRLDVKHSLHAVLEWLKEHGDAKSFVGDTRIIIAPGYDYCIVDRVITNFHQPRSTLLLLVSALIGDRWREAYDYALANDFRFLSYGDACLFDRKS